MKTNVSGVWAIDDEVSVAAPSLASIAEMLRASASRGDAIELRTAALKAADMLQPKAPVVLQGVATHFQDEIGC